VDATLTLAAHPEVSNEDGRQVTDVWLIHGLGDAPRVWRGVRTDPAFKRYRLIAPTLPGLGGTAPLARGHRGVHGVADWLAAQITRRSRGRRVLLVGHSMGGMISTLVAAQHPSLVAGVVNIEGPLTSVDADTSRQASRATDFARWFRRFRRAVQSPESGAPAHYAKSVDEAGAATFLACARDIVALTRTDSMAKMYAGLKVPRTYYYGSAANGLSPATVRWLDANGLETVRFAKAGHWPMTESPAEFSKQLARSLRRLAVE
jgi:pimeloyl-ACP methyl ester carboxylesterase